MLKKPDWIGGSLQIVAGLFAIYYWSLPVETTRIDPNHPDVAGYWSLPAGITLSHWSGLLGLIYVLGGLAKFLEDLLNPRSFVVYEIISGSIVFAVVYWWYIPHFLVLLFGATYLLLQLIELFKLRQ